MRYALGDLVEFTGRRPRTGNPRKVVHHYLYATWSDSFKFQLGIVTKRFAHEDIWDKIWEPNANDNAYIWLPQGSNNILLVYENELRFPSDRIKN